MKNKSFFIYFFSVALLGWSALSLLQSCQSAEPLPQETVLRLQLNDTLSRYDSVVITLVDHLDMTHVLEKVWAGPISTPSQIEGHTLTVAQGKDFIVRIAGYASHNQLRLETLIYYEGEKKTVVHRVPPPYQPLNQLTSLIPSVGKLTPAFKSDMLLYRDTLPLGTKTVKLQLAPLFSKAQVTVKGIPVAAGAASQDITVGNTVDTVVVLVTDATQGIAYTKQYQILLIPTLPAPTPTPTPVPVPNPTPPPDTTTPKPVPPPPDTTTPKPVPPPKPVAPVLASITPSAGILTPVFKPDVKIYSLPLPYSADSVNFVFHSNDTGKIVMSFNNSPIFDNAKSYTIKLTPGKLTGVSFQIGRDSLHTIYLINISRPATP